MLKTVLITGGFGYIGRHTCIELLNSGYKVVVVDNKNIEALEKINNKIFKLTGRKAILRSIKFNCKDDVRSVFIDIDIDIDIVVHFAGIKSVSDFILQPLESVDKELSLISDVLTVMKEFNVKKIIYPSSILVYSSDNIMPLTENSKLNTSNPYSRCKIFIEDLLYDISASDNSWDIIILRYSNTIGSHQSGVIDGYTPIKPNNLTSSILSVFENQTDKVEIYGDDFETRDGTCERDYIHVVDVAKANLSSIEYIVKNNMETPLTLNISSGKPTSVFEVMHGFEGIVGNKIKYDIMPRRSSDIGCSYSDNSLAKDVIKWEPKSNLDDIFKSFFYAQ